MRDAAPARRDDFPVLHHASTRWRDNDVYAHMNNVVYYEFFDTCVNRWLRESGALAVPHGPVVGLVAETRCVFRAPVGFPDALEIGLAAARVGRSSVTYALALFREGAADAAAECRYVHVYVDAGTRRPVPLPDALRAAVEAIARAG